MDTVDITVHPTIIDSISTTGSLSFCEGDSVILSGITNQQYFWNTGDTSRTIVATQAGDYSAQIINIYGCATFSDTISIGILPLPDTTIISYGSPNFCNGGSFAIQGVFGQSYVWNNGATSPALTITDAGNYFAIITTVDGCSDTTATYTTTLFADPDTTVTTSSSLSFCSGSSVSLTAASGQSYLWNTGDTTQSITSNQSGTYFAVVTTANGCSDTTATYTTTLFADPDTSVTASALIFCASDSSVITAAGGQSYLWNTGYTTQSITVNQTGSYSVTVTTVDGCVGVSDTVSATMVPDVVLPQILGDLYGWFASGDTVSFSVVNTGGYQLTWGISGGQITAGQGSDTVGVIWGAADSTASIWVVVSNGVCQDSAYLNLVISGMGSGEKSSARAMAYPNPNAGVFTLEWSNMEAQQVVIYNGVGQVVASQAVEQSSSTAQVDLSTKAAGIYRAVIYGKDGQVTLPVQVRH